LCVEADDAIGGSASGGSGGSAAAGATAGTGGAPPLPDNVARTRFCNDSQFEGLDTTFRLLVLDRVFDAFSQTCSPCQDLPASTMLDFAILKMPEGVVISRFTSELTPGSHVILTTVENGEGIVKDVELRETQRCEDAGL
jgi:hypothetical protein